MRENTGKIKSNFSEFPEEFQHYMQDSFLDFNSTAREKAIEYLLYCYNNKTVSDLMFVKMLDEFMSNVMFPLEFTFMVWGMNTSEIETLLNAEESILKERYQSNRTWNNPVTEDMDNDAPEVLIQRLQLYYCVLYYSSFNKKKHAKKLRELLEITKRNVTYLLNNEYAKDIYEQNEVYGVNNFYLIGFEPFEEPLSTLYHDFGFVTYDPDEFIDVYTQYLTFLKEFECDGYEAEAVRENLEKIAAQRLDDLTDRKLEVDLRKEKYNLTENRKVKRKASYEAVPLLLQAIVLLGFTIDAHLMHFKAPISIKNVLIEIVLYIAVLAVVWCKNKMHLSLIELRNAASDDSVLYLFFMNTWLINYITTACIMAVYFNLLFMLYGASFTLLRLLFFSLETAAPIEFITAIKHLKPKPFRFIADKLFKNNREEEDETDFF